LAQARVAARNRISLDTVLRRYFAGYALLVDFLVCEAEAGGLLARAELKKALRSQAALLDRLLAAVSEEYGREQEQGRLDTAEQRRRERVKRLLAGELLDPSELAYELDGWHLGLVASGPRAAEAIRELAAELECRLLLVRHDERTVWAWLGRHRMVGVADLEPLICSGWPQHAVTSIGEPGEGPAGWRLTHRQAMAALPIALRMGPEPLRYRDVALLATTLQDDLLISSLRRLYLSPLEQERDRGKAAKATLRAYFASDRNVSSTSVTLGVSRRTVAKRLNMIEKRIGRPLVAAAADIEVALDLEELIAPSRLARSEKSTFDFFSH
jgi:hypothetical protein